MTKRTIASWCMAVSMAGVVACGDGGAGPAAPTPLRGSPGSGLSAAPPSVLAFSGTVTEMTAAGPMPVQGAYVEVCGFDSALSDERGFYSLTSVPSDTPYLAVQKAGYRFQTVTLNVSPGGRLDIRLERE